MRESNDTAPADKTPGPGGPAAGRPEMTPRELAERIAWSYHYGLPGGLTGLGVFGACSVWGAPIGWLHGVLVALAILAGLSALVHGWLLALAAREYADVLALTRSRRDPGGPPERGSGSADGGGDGFDPRKEPWWG